jgi:hypothetical protein
VAGDRRIGRLGLSFAGAAVTLALCAVPAAAGGRPDLVETGVAILKFRVAAGSSLPVTDLVRNRGDAAAPRSRTGFYLSRDRRLGRGDIWVGGKWLEVIAPGSGWGSRTLLRIPGSAAPGTYWLLGCADFRHLVPESNERNNCRAAASSLRVTRRSGDRTPPRFAGLQRAITCIPGPIGKGRASKYRLAWNAASDNVTPAAGIEYDIYQASTAGGENFSKPTYRAAPGATQFFTPALPSDEAFYFVVRARDRAGNRERNKVERLGMNLCE